MSAREGNQDPGLRAYLATLEASSRTHPRYNWLKGYFQQDPEFEKERLYPFVPGRTRTIVANFFEPPIPPTISCPATLEELDQTLSTRSSEAAVRLIFVTAISGVDEQVRIAQLLGTARGRNLRERLSSDELAPVVTRARTAGDSTTLLHPFHGHSSYLPDPKVLSRIAAATKVEPGILLRHLDQQEHLVYRSHTWTRHETQADENTGRWLDFSLGVDQQNFITAAMLTKTLGHLRGTNKYRHTLLMLATEDNCLGIDFNKFASALDQPAVSYDGTPHQAFEAILRFMSEEKLRSILVNPLGLVWDYTAGLSKAFACQVELYRRKWICLYEPYANTSAVYGDAESRDHVRKEAKLLSRHLQYLHQSLSNLRQIMAGTQRNSRPGIKIETNETVRAFKDVSRLLEPLKSAYDNFIEQQRLSYLGFVFAPLSLASSFFSINIRPLGGQASLWSFVVTSMSTLCLSILVLLSLNSRIHQKVFRSSQSGQPRFVSGHARSKEPGLPETKTMHPSPNLQKQDIETGQPLSELVSHMTGQTAAPSQLAAGVEPSSAWAPARKPARIPPNDSERSWEWERLWGRENQITVPHAPPVRIEYADPPYRGTISNVITAVSAQRPSSQLERLVYTMPPPPNISLSVSSNASKSSCTSKRTEKSLQPVNSNEYIPKAKRALSSEGGSITNDRVLDMTPCTVVKSTPQVISLASKSSTSNRSNDNAVLRKMEDGPVEIGDTEQNQENPDTSTFAFGMAQMWKSSHPDDGRKWWPGDEEVSMFIMLKRLCEERDAAEIKRTVSLRPWWRSNLKFDIIYGLALVEAACHLLIDALPVFYSAIKNRKIRIECLATALGMTIGDSEGHLATLQWLGIRGVRLNI
ncbi:uncharacterized protein BO97DRAFT_190222 [Aspergillus homomorphus CBS 101889]|uniref:Uncharacterized protein n=1 Tax=Aspergillus homomorphus (strain CBS 101889) TaxID=1450537 RepID=A0A395HSA2_ASPHC|nr:hypothetical protein BO97DRAFT_190222 [Aspergillus homomorphus CBS 101889]RAL09124.1 hypothetical protein BO97DRAFT_190222 [Aspergillus homomorphus CBS 101889]